jgi:Ca2+-binding RTX toxin-like protein
MSFLSGCSIIARVYQAPVVGPPSVIIPTQKDDLIMRRSSRLAGAALAATLLAGTTAVALADVVEGTPGTDFLDGTSGDDTIRGFGGGDQLNGFGGADHLLGGGGGDGMEGGPGPDLLQAGPGHDTLFGRRGPDALYGGKGFDVLEGGPQNDLLYAGAGDDTLVLSNSGDEEGRDYANCGAGVDTVYVNRDSVDDIRPNCEIITFVN